MCIPQAGGRNPLCLFYTLGNVCSSRAPNLTRCCICVRAFDCISTVHALLSSALSLSSSFSSSLPLLILIIISYLTKVKEGFLGVVIYSHEITKTSLRKSIVVFVLHCTHSLHDPFLLSLLSLSSCYL